MRKWLRITILASLIVLTSPLYSYPALAVLYDTTTPIYVVQTSSFEPKFSKGDILFISHRESVQKLNVGDFVVYHRGDTAPEHLSLGLVIEIVSDESSVRIKTTFANLGAFTPPDDVSEMNYVGKVVGAIPL
jgi:signal peptidase I